MNGKKLQAPDCQEEYYSEYQTDKDTGNEFS